MRDVYKMQYYPLIDATDDENIKAPMFPTENLADCMKSGKPYLSELIPHLFHLHGDASGMTIHCPYCGKVMNRITEITKGALFVCPECED